LPLGRGTIVFPSHSAEGKVYGYSASEVIKLVESSFPPPFTASIYNQDQDHPRTKIYRDAGWRLVSFGSRHSQMFLYRQAVELAVHEFVVGNMVQTALFYGGLFGRTIAVIGSGVTIEQYGSQGDPTVESHSHLEHDRICRDRWPRLFTDGIAGDEAIEIAEAELGVACLLSPEELLSALGWSSPLKRTAARLLAHATDLVVGKSIRQGTIPGTRPDQGFTGPVHS
jgi:hypothetical protein